jgi:hypothetical protein
MNPSIRAISKSMRYTVMAAMIVATSGMLEGAGLPIFSAFGGIVRNLAAAQSEAKRLRDQAAASLRYVTRKTSYQFRHDPAGITCAPGQSVSGRAAAGPCAWA